MKRVLIVASTYQPAMAPDMHRARLLAWELKQFGWDVEILHPDSSYQRKLYLDHDSDEFFASDTTTHPVGPWRPRLFDALRIHGMTWRAAWPIYRQGARLLASGRFDLVYFATTQFPWFCLGRIWHRRFGVPYVLDFQDPWYRPRQNHRVAANRFKAWVSAAMARPLERFAVAKAAGLVAVSPHYLDELGDRYAAIDAPWKQAGRCRAIPFAASERDLEIAGIDKSAGSTNHAESNPPDVLDLVYVGVGGVTRALGFESLCQGLAELKRNEPELARRVRIRLYGTMVTERDDGPRPLAELAQQYDVGEMVDEHPRQASYRRSLQLAALARGLLILGVDDAGYTPSKLFNYLLFGKPVLSVLRSDTPACEFVDRHPKVSQLIRFGATRRSSSQQSAAAIAETLHAMIRGEHVDRRPLLAEHLSTAMAREHAEFFDRCLDDASESIAPSCSSSGTNHVNA